MAWLSADRFYPSSDLFAWLDAHGWSYRLRLKGNLLTDPGHGDETTTGELSQGVTERYLGVRLFAQGVMTHLGILHEADHPDPWTIAMDCVPTRATESPFAGNRKERPSSRWRNGLFFLGGRKGLGERGGEAPSLACDRGRYRMEDYPLGRLGARSA